MTIQAVHFDIPSDIQVGLDSGDLFRFGGVVRDSFGHIVEHLKEVPFTEESQEAVGRVAARLKNPWVITALGLSAVAAGGSMAFLTVKKRKQIRKRLESYNASLRAYLEAVRDGAMNVGIISQLISDLDAIKEQSDDDSITVDFPTEQSEKLVNLAVNYTRKLAEANSVELSGLLERGRIPENDAVVDLRRHLEAQRRIFTKAA